MAEGIKTDDGFSVEKLVQEIFVRGACKNIFNIKAEGDKSGIGYFENGESSIGIKRGIILATGPIGNSAGPNNERDISGDFKDLNGDADLQKITAIKVQDAVGLEFDFIPLDSLVTFRYVFASEEYCEFVGSKYNDVFGFFISGPGINGPFSNNSENIALVPGTKDFVSINNVNHKTNANYFVRNEREEDAKRCNIPWAPTPNLDLIEYDGFTKVLTATLRLIPCKTYKLRLVIADVNDGNYDSAVFLEAESFNIGGAVNLTVGSGLNSLRDTIKEGCSGGFFQVNRLDSTKTDVPISIGLRVSDASKATLGVDFDSIPKKVTIPVGEKFVRIPIKSRVDNQFEFIEDIIVELDFPCACIADTAKLYVEDPPKLKSGLAALEVCVGDTVSIMSKASGGVPGYQFHWSTGDSSSSIRVFAPRDTSYRLKVADACGRKIEDSVQVKRRVPPYARISGMREVCLNDTVIVPVHFFGIPPYSFSYTINNKDEKTESGIYLNPYPLVVKQEGKVVLKKFSDAICEGIPLGNTLVRYYEVLVSSEIKPVTCNGDKDGAIQLKIETGYPPYQYNWGKVLTNRPNAVNLGAGKYALTITDANNCQTNLNLEVTQPPALKPIAFDCREFTSDFISFSPAGGTPPFLYSINGSEYKDESIFQKLTPGLTYDVAIQDAVGCKISQTLLMPTRYTKMLELDPSLLLKLGDEATLQPKLNIPQTLIEKIAWFPIEGLSCSDCLFPLVKPLKNQTYVLNITDVFGCLGSGFVNVRLDRQYDVFVPTAFSPNGDGTNDLLIVYANIKQVKSIRSFRIFNRWGSLMFEHLDFSPNESRIGWDGYFQGNQAIIGVYLYLVEVELIDGTVELVKGETALVR
jgi:gliding motility-associated-like protein